MLFVRCLIALNESAKALKNHPRAQEVWFSRLLIGFLKLLECLVFFQFKKTGLRILMSTLKNSVHFEHLEEEKEEDAKCWCSSVYTGFFTKLAGEYVELAENDYFAQIAPECAQYLLDFMIISVRQVSLDTTFNLAFLFFVTTCVKKLYSPNSVKFEKVSLLSVVCFLLFNMPN